MGKRNSKHEAINTELRSYVFSIQKLYNEPEYWKRMIGEIYVHFILAHSEDLEFYKVGGSDIKVLFDSLLIIANKIHISSREDMLRYILNYIHTGNKCYLKNMMPSDRKYKSVINGLIGLIYDEVDNIGRERFNDFEKLK